MRATVHIKNMAVSGAQKGSGSGYAIGLQEPPLSAVKSNAVERNCGRRSRAKEKKSPSRHKARRIAPPAAQAAHPPLPAPLIATGPHHRPQLESGAGDEKLFASHDLLLRGPSPGIK